MHAGYKGRMYNARAVVVRIEDGGQNLWRIHLEVSVPTGTLGLEPTVLYRLGPQPQATGILILNAPEPLVVTVRGKPWVQVGDSIPIVLRASRDALRQIQAHEALVIAFDRAA